MKKQMTYRHTGTTSREAMPTATVHPAREGRSPCVSEADKWYREGNIRRRHQDWQGALNCYREAINLDSTSPAVHARDMLMNIIEFRNKDMYNP